MPRAKLSEIDAGQSAQSGTGRARLSDIGDESQLPTTMSLGQKAADYAQSTAIPALEHVASGIGGGAIGLMDTGSEWASKHLPRALTSSWFGFGKPVDEEKFRQAYVQPHNTGEQVGNAAEKTAEFFIPGGAEDWAARSAGNLAKVLPKGAKAADTLAHIAIPAVSAGAVNKAQGGDFGTGAALGAGSEVAGMGARKLAPIVTEFAQGIHTPGAKSGKAILDETGSIFPGAVRRSAQKVLDVLNPELERAANASEEPISISGPREVGKRQVEKALMDKAPKTVKGTKKLNDMLYFDNEGNEIPEHVTPREALGMKRRVGDAYSWNPARKASLTAPRNAIYGSLNDVFENAVPEGKNLNRRITALIPATEPSKGGFGHLWGPGAGAIFGGYYGARAGARNARASGTEGLTGAIKGGLQGAAEGATAGTLLPAALNTGARAMYSRVLPKVIVGTAAQATHRRAK